MRKKSFPSMGRGHPDAQRIERLFEWCNRDFQAFQAVLVVHRR
jgi:hypothetical protein